MRGIRFDGQENSEGSESGELVYEQSVPAILWTISHSLGRYPTVVVIDSAGDNVSGDVRYPDTTTVTIAFGAAFSGRAVLRT